MSYPIFIAEVSANHLGNLDRAKEIVYSVAKSGATAIKFQTYTADTMTLDIESFRISKGHDLWGDRKLYDLYQEAHTPWEWHLELFELARSLNLIPFSSPFDLSAVECLEKLQTPMYKIASMETGDLELIKTVAETGKPIIMSTGASTIEEIDDAVETVMKTGNKKLTLLLCTSSYPATPADSHLKRIDFLRTRYNLDVGLSDHTLGLGVSVAAIALGAVAIEKHFTLKRSDGGADGSFSMEPQEFTELVAEGRRAYDSLGICDWQIQESEMESRRLRRSLYIVKDVKKGELATEENLRAIRPGYGISPKYYRELLGKRFSDDYVIGTPMKLEYVV